jgi:hypothetical protein
MGALTGCLHVISVFFWISLSGGARAGGLKWKYLREWGK